MRWQTLPCPSCHMFKNPGNKIEEKELPWREGIWIVMIFSCGKHQWAKPKDPQHPDNLHGFNYYH